MNLLAKVRLKYAYKDGSGWHTETADSAGTVGQYSDITLDTSGYPHISCHYSDMGIVALRYVYKNGSGWHSENADTAGSVGYYTSIALDTSGYPHISEHNYYLLTGLDLKYAYKDGSGWHISNLDTAGNVGLYTSLALDDSNCGRISYYDGTNGDLKYAYKDGSGWHTETLDSTGTVGLYTSIALDNSDNAHISYYDGTNGDLKYTYWTPGSNPAVSSTDPADGATDVSVSQTINVTFDSDIQAGDNYAQIDVKHQNGTSVPFTKSIAGAVLTIDPTGNLSNSVTYTVYVPENSVKDLNNNGLASDYAFSFTTEADTTAPTVNSTDPADGATGVAVNKTITVTFNEDIQAGANYGDIRLEPSAAISKSIAGAVLTIDPDSDLTNSVTYTVYIPAGSIKDLANNALASDYTFSFTTTSGGGGGGEPTITIMAPSGISGWSLNPSASQPQTQTGTLSVAVDPESTAWEVTATDEDTANTNGKMTAWNGSYDTNKKLSNAMKVASDYEVTLPAGGKIADGTGDRSIDVTFKQTVAWNDPPLSGGYSYRIVVTFTASITP